MFASYRQVDTLKKYRDEHKTFSCKKELVARNFGEKAGTIQQYIERIENQKSEVGSYLLVNIAEALGVSVDTLIQEIKF